MEKRRETNCEIVAQGKQLAPLVSEIIYQLGVFTVPAIISHLIHKTGYNLGSGGGTHLPVSVSLSSNTGVSMVQAPWRSKTAVMAAKAAADYNTVIGYSL